MNQSGNDLHSIRRMLREIADLAENASLTGSLSSGITRAVQRYNSVLRQLVESGTVGKGLFDELNPETTDYGQLGVDARLLGSYLKGQDGDGGNGGDASMLVRLAPFIRGEDLALLVKEHLAKGAQINTKVITSLAPFLGSDQLGQLVREHMIADAAATPPAAPTATSQPVHEGLTLAELAERLSRPELSREERADIARRLAEMAQR